MLCYTITESNESVQRKELPHEHHTKITQNKLFTSSGQDMAILTGSPLSPFSEGSPYDNIKVITQCYFKW